MTVVTMDGTVLELNGALEKNNTGIDLRQLFIGSEGTLGVIAEATLKLCPLPDEAATRVCFFAVRDFRAVLELFRLARQGPFLISAFECLSAKCMREVEAFGLRAPFVPGDAGAAAGAYVLMEVEEQGSAGMEDWIAEAFELRASDGVELVLDGTMAQNSRERGTLWALRERVAEAVLHRDLDRGRSGIVHQQDLSVPIASLVDFFSDIETRYESAYPEFQVFIFGHIGDGNLHIFIRKPVGMADAEFHSRCEPSDTMLFELCAKHRGSVSAEHGVGILKKPALPYTRSAVELHYLRGLKQVLDPKGLLNPGKIL
jgi:FAD/FMN-containing dehydrogenase